MGLIGLIGLIGMRGMIVFVPQVENRKRGGLFWAPLSELCCWLEHYRMLSA